LRGFDAVAMSAVAINMKLDRNLGIEKGVVEIDCLPRVGCIVEAGGSEECGGALLGT